MSLIIEDLIEKTGYSKATVYNLCSYLGIKAKKGSVPGKISKGTYNEQDLEKLLLYKKYIETGLSREEAHAKILSFQS